MAPPARGSSLDLHQCEMHLGALPCTQEAPAARPERIALLTAARPRYPGGLVSGEGWMRTTMTTPRPFTLERQLVQARQGSFSTATPSPHEQSRAHHADRTGRNSYGCSKTLTGMSGVCSAPFPASAIDYSGSRSRLRVVNRAPREERLPPCQLTWPSVTGTLKRLVTTWMHTTSITGQCRLGVLISSECLLGLAKVRDFSTAPSTSTIQVFTSFENPLFGCAIGWTLIRTILNTNPSN